MAELLARIRALLRRSHRRVSAQLCIGHICLDVSTRAVTLAGQHVPDPRSACSNFSCTIVTGPCRASTWPNASGAMPSTPSPCPTISTCIWRITQKTGSQAGDVIIHPCAALDTWPGIRNHESPSWRHLWVSLAGLLSSLILSLIVFF